MESQPKLSISFLTLKDQVIIAHLDQNLAGKIKHRQKWLSLQIHQKQPHHALYAIAEERKIKQLTADMHLIIKVSPL